MSIKTVLSLVLLIGCGGKGSNTGDTTGDDASVGDDGGTGSDGAAVDAPAAPAMITLTGIVSSRAGVGAGGPVNGATVSVFASANEATPLATATSNNGGVFTLMVPTGGTAVDGYIQSTATNFTSTFFYPATPFAADEAMIKISMVTTAGFGTLGLGAGVQQKAGNGLVEILVAGTNGAPIADATAASTPAAGAVRYDSNGGAISANAQATSGDGLAYLFNVPAGAATVTATKTGTTFASHGLKVRADQLTTTIVKP